MCFSSVYINLDGHREEVMRGVTLKEIKSAYRRLAHRHHPDKHSGATAEETEEMMKRLNSAYNCSRIIAVTTNIASERKM